MAPPARTCAGFQRGDRHPSIEQQSANEDDAIGDKAHQRACVARASSKQEPDHERDVDGHGDARGEKKRLQHRHAMDPDSSATPRGGSPTA